MRGEAVLAILPLFVRQAACDEGTIEPALGVERIATPRTKSPSRAWCPPTDRQIWRRCETDAVQFVNVVRPRDGGPLPLPLLRLRDPARTRWLRHLPVCFWEDDGQDDHDTDEVRGGPNYALSLTVARANYRRIGAAEDRVLPHVRTARPSELQSGA